MTEQPKGNECKCLCHQISPENEDCFCEVDD